MADINIVKIDYELLADSTLETVQKNNVILQHMNMDYNDQVFKTSPVGMLNNSVEVIVTIPQDPASLWTGATQYVAYAEGSVKLVLDKISDKSHEFNLLTTTLNQSAVERAGDVLGKAHADRYEIEIIKEAYSVASPIVLPSGKLETSADYAKLEKEANDANIASENTVVLVNSTTRMNMGSSRLLFSLSQGKEQKFTDGLGANTNFSNGNGFITKEFGLNFFLTSLLSESNMAKYGLGWANPTAESIVVDSLVANVVYGIGAPAQRKVLQLNVVNYTVDTALKAGTVIIVGDKAFKLKIDVNFSEAITSNSLEQDQVYGDFTNTYIQADAPVTVLNKAKSSGFNSLLISNKAIAFAAKSPQITSAEQSVSFDPFTSMALRVWKHSEIDSKSLKVSSDSIFGVKAFLPYQIKAFQG